MRQLLSSAVALYSSVEQSEQPSVKIDPNIIRVERLTPDLINLAVIIVFVILFLRTAAPNLNSRYLKHLAGAYALIGLFYFSSIFLLICKLILFFSAHTVPGQQSQIISVITELEKVGELIKLIFSSLSSCFLLLTWYLLRHYPEEGISKWFYSGVFTAYITAIPSLIVIAQAFKWDELKAMNVTDSVFAFIGVFMVGLGLCRLIQIQKKWSRPARDIATFFVVSAFLFWAVPQPFYNWYRSSPLFWLFLAAGKVVAGLVTILVSVAVMQAKEQYVASGDAS